MDSNGALMVAFGRARTPFPELTFVCFPARKVYILTFWMGLPGSFVVAFGRARVLSSELTFVCFPIRKMYILIFWMGLCGTFGNAFLQWLMHTFRCALLTQMHSPKTHVC